MASQAYAQGGLGIPYNNKTIPDWRRPLLIYDPFSFPSAIVATPVELIKGMV